MVANYNKYKIKAGDTLKSLACAMNLSTSEVANFHNVYANQNSLIGVEFPFGLAYLFIPAKFSENQINKVPKVNFLYDGKLEIKPFNDKLMYNVSISINQIANEYAVSISFLKKHNSFSFYLFEKIINDEDEPDTVIEELMQAISKALYPLEMIVDQNGNLTGINNFKSINKKWQKVKVEILDYFTGKEVLARLAFYDKLFLNKNRFFKLLQNDLFLFAFFNNQFTNHTNSFLINHNSFIPVFANIAPCKYNINQQVNEYLSPENKIEILQQGSLTDERSIIDYEYELDEPFFTNVKVNGTFLGHCTLNCKTNVIEKIHCNFVLELQERMEVNVNIKLQ